MNFKAVLAFGLAGLVGAQDVAAQAFESIDYVRALWMATRFYGGQRAGVGPNWLSIDMDTKYRTSFTNDNYQGTDVSGGWFDCGDHVMFGQTQYWSAYSLAKAYEAFPQGFHDLYNGVDYSDYVAKNSWNNVYGGTPNGIPDIIDELVYETDYIAKAAISSTVFISRKGDPSKDHNRWVVPGLMSLMNKSNGGECATGADELYEDISGTNSGPWLFKGNLKPCTSGYTSREVLADPDKTMASYGAATLAVMSRLLTQLDIYPERASLYAQKAAIAYAAATNTSGNVAYGEFYPTNKNQADDYVTASLEMYALTGATSYLDNAKANASGVNTHHNWAYNYNNNDDMAFYNLAMANATDSASKNLTTYAEYYKSKINVEGVSEVGDPGWGTLRYPLGGAYVMALTNKVKNATTYDTQIYQQVDFVMGANDAKQSYITGFQKSADYKMPLHPHHRGYYQSMDNPDNNFLDTLHAPEKNWSHGALMGSQTFRSGTLVDNAKNYKYTEICTDYNVGLVGALAYIVSKTSPVGNELPIYVPSPTLKQAVASATFSLARSAGTYEFSSNIQQPFTVTVYDLRGTKVATLSSSGESVRYSPASTGVFQALVKSGSNSASYRLSAF